MLYYFSIYRFKEKSGRSRFFPECGKSQKTITEEQKVAGGGNLSDNAAAKAGAEAAGSLVAKPNKLSSSKSPSELTTQNNMKQ